MPLLPHLLEDRFGDVVVGAPVGGALGIGELVHEVAARGAGQALRLGTDRVGVCHQVAAPAIELDRGDLFGRRVARHHGQERQAEQAREVGLRDGGGAARRFHHGAALVQPAVRQRIQEQRTRQAMLQAAGGVARFVLEVDIDARKSRQRQRNQVGVGRAVEVGVDAVDGLRHPGALGHGVGLAEDVRVIRTLARLDAARVWRALGKAVFRTAQPTTGSGWRVHG